MRGREGGRRRRAGGRAIARHRPRPPPLSLPPPSTAAVWCTAGGGGCAGRACIEDGSPLALLPPSLTRQHGGVGLLPRNVAQREEHAVLLRERGGGVAQLAPQRRHHRAVHHALGAPHGGGLVQRVWSGGWGRMDGRAVREPTHRARPHAIGRTPAQRRWWDARCTPKRDRRVGWPGKRSVGWVNSPDASGCGSRTLLPGCPAPQQQQGGPSRLGSSLRGGASAHPPRAAALAGGTPRRHVGRAAPRTRGGRRQHHRRRCRRSSPRAALPGHRPQLGGAAGPGVVAAGRAGGGGAVRPGGRAGDAALAAPHVWQGRPQDQAVS